MTHYQARITVDVDLANDLGFTADEEQYAVAEAAVEQISLLEAPIVEIRTEVGPRGGFTNWTEVDLEDLRS